MQAGRQAGAEHLAPNHIADIARFRKITPRRDIIPLADRMPPPLAQTLNYDILSIIFVISSQGLSSDALTLSSVCRQWRSTALSVPEIWSKIYVGPSITPYSLYISLERSKPLSLHIAIHNVSSNEQLQVLSSAADRIICMTIMNSCRFLRNQFPILERLVLMLDKEADHKIDGEKYFSKSSQLSQLREFFFISAPRVPPIFDVRGGFPGLQKLEITCDDGSNWYNVVQSASNTLISLSFFVRPISDEVYDFFFPQLRHLLITACDDADMVLYFDAPHLESVEQMEGVGGFGVAIQVKNPSSVKQLLVVRGPLDLTHYPALRKLWINLYDLTILESLEHQITFCPELEVIFYGGQSQDKETNYGKSESSLPELVSSAIVEMVRETERDIAVREFRPTELELPGSMRRKNVCFGSLRDQSSEHILSEFY